MKHNTMIMILSVTSQLPSRVSRLKKHYYNDVSILVIGALDSCWLLLCGALVMFMHAGSYMYDIYIYIYTHNHHHNKNTKIMCMYVYTHICI